MPKPQSLRLSLLAAVIAVSAAPSQAATHLWIGPNGGNWSTPANWIGMSPPTSGEFGGTVVFFNLGNSSNANIAGLTVDQIVFGSSGNTIHATSALTLATGEKSPTVSDGFGGNTIDGSLVLSGYSLADVEVTNTANGVLTLAADMSGTPGQKLRLAGNIALTGTNTYSPGTTIVTDGLVTLDSPTTDGAIPGSLYIGIDSVNGSVTVKELSNNNIANSGHVYIYPNGKLDLNGHIEKVFAVEDTGTQGYGDVALGNGGWLQLQGSAANSEQFYGVISGSGTVTKYGTNSQYFFGNNTFTGGTTVAGGILDVEGIQSASNMVVANGGTLTGKGTVGPLSVSSGGTVDPGIGATGILHSGALTMAAGSALKIALQGTVAGSGYDRLAVAGNASLGGASLEVTLGFASVDGDSFSILTYTGTLSGTFNGLPEGAALVLNGKNFVIHYDAAAKAVVLKACTPLAAVTIDPVAPVTICSTGTGGFLSVNDTFGGPWTHQWGYRTAPGGVVTQIPGETGMQYTVKGTDFPSAGTYYVVCITSPFCGSPTPSNEVSVTVSSDPTPPTVTAPNAITITQTACN